MDPGILSTFYVDDAVFDGSTGRSVQLVKLLRERRTDRGYLSVPSRLLLIDDSLEHEEAYKREFTTEGLELNFVGGSKYLG